MISNKLLRLRISTEFILLLMIIRLLQEYFNEGDKPDNP